MFRKQLKNLIYTKLKIKIKDIIVFSIFLLFFYLIKNQILLLYFKYYAHQLNNANIKIAQLNYIEYNVLLQENNMLKKILNIKNTRKKHFIVAKPLSNIYSSTDFWAIVPKNATIKIGNCAWYIDKLFGKRLLGFVIDKTNNFIKIRPITHINSRIHVSTFTGGQLLLNGKNKNLSIILSNSNLLKNNEIVYFEDEFFVGFYANQLVKCPDFYEIKWFCINI